ncbi:MAG: chorismate mutase [Planctomycetia bacterium]|nr:chorismate mutase [Planctomycetia bacterium]
MYCRGVRGATTIEENTSEAILRGTQELLALMIRRNGIQPEDVASVIFTVTHDLDAEFPAIAARQFGWSNVALMCGNELDVPGSLRRCIRILIHWNTEKSSEEINHIYIRGAVNLRPDIRTLPTIDQEALEKWIEEHFDASVPVPKRPGRGD